MDRSASLLLLFLWCCAVPASTVTGFLIDGSRDPTPLANAPIPKNTKILVLPGFGNDARDYTADGSLVPSLRAKGWAPDQLRVLPLERSDWGRVFLRGAMDRQFWTGDAGPTRPAFAWYLERIAEEIGDLLGGDGEARVVLVGHSAGGWLGRAALGFFGSRREPADVSSGGVTPIDLSRVAGLVTLGTPHSTPSMDVTRGALRITNEWFPGCYHTGLFYLTAMGLVVPGGDNEHLAFRTYEGLCGDGTTVGDGIVPRCAGHLEDAVQLDLEGCWHSRHHAPGDWYGSAGVIDEWHDPMLQQIYQRTTTRAATTTDRSDRVGLWTER